MEKGYFLTLTQTHKFMAEDKKGFILYADYVTILRKLCKDDDGKKKAGELFLMILEYVNDTDPTTDDYVLDLVFEPIKNNLKRDLKKYEKFRSKQSENGKLGGRPKAKITQITQAFISETQKSPIDIVIDNVIVKDNVKVKESLRSNVSLHRTEIETLKRQYSEDELNWMLDKLSAYKLSKGKNYKSDYGAICSWVIDRLKEEKLKEKNSAKKENGKTTNFEHLATAYTDIPD